MKHAWLQPFTWAVIVETNRQLCLPKGALHKLSSNGYEPTRQLWESLHRTAMTLADATNLCRRCHQLAPFCNFNGNTFVAVIRKVTSTLPLPPDQAAAMRSLASHIVEGIATSEEQRLFEKAIAEISALDEPSETVHGSSNELAGSSSKWTIPIAVGKSTCRTE